MHDTSHAGAFPSGLNGASRRDPMTAAQDVRLGNFESAATRGLNTTKDVNRALGVTDFTLGNSQLFFGLISHAIPHAGWYRVNLDSLQGVVPCCSLSQTGMLPMGCRQATTYATGTLVVVYKQRNVPYGYILGAIPPRLADDRAQSPDFLMQGGMSGMRQEECHRYPVANMFNQGGVIAFCADRPRDLTSLETVFSSPTGVLLGINDMMFELRINEMCGISGNIYDGFLRVAGMQLLIESPAHELFAGNDEGELYYDHHKAVYPWEALGAFDPLTDPSAQYTKGDGFTDAFKNQDNPSKGQWPKAPTDLKQPDIKPVYRVEEFGGYLGQGGMRSVVGYNRNTGLNTYGDDPQAVGLFTESIGLNGAYALSSAKSVIFAKRAINSHPRRIRVREQSDGDDAKTGNYKASSLFGDSKDHKVGDILFGDADSQLKEMMAADSCLAYELNWRRLHPFVYHENDFAVPQESADVVFGTSQTPFDLFTLQQGGLLPSPVPKRLKIDHRYNEVSFYENQSMIFLTERGGILQADAYGSAIKMVGGKVRIETPGNLELMAGGDVVIMGRQVVLRAHDDVDISAANGDIRQKAEFNYHVLAGNSGQGGVMVENKSVHKRHDYDQKVGKEVESNGIVFKCAEGQFAAIASDIYLRSGEGGGVTVDANQGQGNFIAYCDNANIFANKTVSFFYGPQLENSEINQVYMFGANQMMIEADCFVGGSITMYGASKDFLCSGNVTAKSNVIAVGEMSKRRSGMVGETPTELSGQLDSVISDVSTAVEAMHDYGKSLHEADVTFKYYQANQIGNSDVISSMAFSYRDRSAQYKTGNLLWEERHWEQLRSLGIISGGKTWYEPPVSYQGEDLYPWPGRQIWVEDAAFLTQGETLIDASGNAKDRTDPLYESPDLSSFTRATIAGNFCVLE